RDGFEATADRAHGDRAACGHPCALCRGISVQPGLHEDGDAQRDGGTRCAHDADHWWGQGPDLLFAESATMFFARAADTRFTFLTDPDGFATGLVLHHPRFNRTVKKVR